MRVVTMGDQIERYLSEVGYGLLDLGTCGADPEDAADAGGALGVALRQRLAEGGVL